jgi:uncharacterized membrane protein YeaQ/YmgE (transglycosylase-associated protein family)
VGGTPAAPLEGGNNVIGFILWMLLLGLIAGAVARAVVPGPDSMGIGMTIVLGIVGSFVGGFLANALFTPGDQEGFGPAGIIGSILGAIVVLLLVRLAGRGSYRTGRRGIV